MNAEQGAVPAHPSPHPTASEALQIAQNLAKNCGYAVLPCVWDTKQPVRPEKEGGHGYKDASTDPERITFLWRHWPGALIGVATGVISGFDVLDIDAKHETAPAWWKAASKSVPPTRIYQTRSSGFHVYFQHADGVRNTKSKLAKGVDTRGDGGYAIHWFSAGFPCLDHSPPAPWPAWLLDCVLWKPEPPTVRQRLSTRNPSEAINGIVRVVAGAPEGQRNALLFWGARKLRERTHSGQITRREAVDMLTGAARDAGLPAVEIQRTIASGWKSQ